MLCRNYAFAGYCSWGQRCKFSHSREVPKKGRVCPSGPMYKLAWERKCKYDHKIEQLYCREGRLCKSWPNCKARHFDSDVEYLRTQKTELASKMGIGKDEMVATAIKKRKMDMEKGREMEERRKLLQRQKRLVEKARQMKALEKQMQKEREQEILLAKEGMDRDREKVNFYLDKN